ncbi:MAG: DUF2721 domain-containing protein [Verrucomicrobiae bacterium]|nr:DUF2721 domain-containing protein [Verrucomicrobiae bacterium]
MPPLTLNELVPLLQTAIGPVILISGVGLLLLTMTNRLARVVDRSRALGRELREADGDNRHRLRGQLAILDRRGRLIRGAIALVLINALLASLLIVALFVGRWFAIEIAWLICVLFIGAMACLVVALVQFLRDVNLSLDALRLELRDLRADGPAK